MVTQCKNCAGQLVFDPKKQMLVCDHCGSEFKPEDFDDSEKSGLWDKKAESMNEVYGTDSEDLMDMLDALTNEYEDVINIELASEFLEAEVALCRLVQNFQRDVIAGLNFE